MCDCQPLFAPCSCGCPPDYSFSGVTSDCPNFEPCDELLDAGCIIYTGPNLTHIGITTGARLDVILKAIDTKLGSP